MKKKLVLAVLLIAMVLSAFNCTAFADNGDTVEETTPDNFVLLLDCSMTMGSNDRDNLCIAACKNFMDTIPTENAKVSVIAFGYKDLTANDDYRFSAKLSSSVGVDKDRVHVIVPLSELSDPVEKEEYKTLIEQTSNKNRNNTDTYTPIGYALAAAVDMLEQQGAEDDKAAIILVSDGVEESRTPDIDAKLLEDASVEAGEHAWNIYGVELNYSLSNRETIEEADNMFDTICGNSASEKVGRVSCANPIDVYIALQSIFADYFSLDVPTPEKVTLPASEDFVVPQLASETTINIFGSAVTSVTLTNNDTGTTATYTESVTNDDVNVAVEKGSYFSIKMICPEAGNWTLYIDGTDQAEAYFNTVTLQEMGVKMTTKANMSGASLAHSDSISVNACFSYQGKDQLNNKFYETNPGILEVTCSRNPDEPYTYTMSANKDGYYYDLSLADIPSGVFTMRVVVKNAMFRDGEKGSEIQKFTLGNQELYLKDNAANIELTAYANSSFDPIDVDAIFINPDNDPIEYIVTSVSDPSDVFDASLTDEGLVIESGNRNGDYEVTIQAKDPEMDYYLSHNAVLHVDNRAPESTKDPAKITLLYKPYSFYKTARTEIELNMDDYFADPDGLPLTYTFSNGECVKVTQNGSQLMIEPTAKGETTLTVTASDGVKSTSADMQVKVLNGKAVYWQHYGIFYLIALAIIVIIVIAIIVILKNKRVKGSWTITVDENGMQAKIEQYDIGSYTMCGRKGKFTLAELLPELLPSLENGDGSAHAILLDLGKFQTGTSAVTLLGVYGKKGLGVKYTPAKGVGNCSTVINCSGTIVTKSGSTKNGYLIVTITDNTTGDTLSFKME